MDREAITFDQSPHVQARSIKLNLLSFVISPQGFATRKKSAMQN
jgi:hypothetical protein